MRSVRRLVAMCAMVVAMHGVVGGAAPEGPPEAARETAATVRKALARLPYYGVFDFIAFSLESGTVTLKGYAYRPSLKHEAESAVRRALQADVVNRIEILPSSPYDDRIRWDAFQRVYTDDIASKYVPGGQMRVRYELMDMRLFPGMEPYGTYPVHIVVKDRTLLLIGVLDNDLDKTQVLIGARQTLHTRGVEDAIMVRPGR